MQRCTLLVTLSLFTLWVGHSIAQDEPDPPPPPLREIRKRTGPSELEITTERAAAQKLADKLLATKDVPGLLRARYDRRHSNSGYIFGEAIVSLGKQAVPALVDLLKDTRNPRRCDGAQVLVSIAEKHGAEAIKPATDALAGALTGDDLTKLWALEALAALGPEGKRAVPSLEKALQAEKWPFDRVQIAKVLVKVAGKDHLAGSQALQQFEKDQRLVKAAAKGELAAVKKALDAGASINARYFDDEVWLEAGFTDYTPLMMATYRGRTDVVKFLLARGADADVETRFAKETAIYSAVVKNRNEISDLLVKAGARDDPNKIRLTRALHRAACLGFKLEDGEGYPRYPGYFENTDQAESIEVVLKKGAQIDWANPSGYTALMYAANLGLLDNVKTLLAKGANVNLKSASGITALDLARESGHVQVVDVLKKAGAREEQKLGSQVRWRPQALRLAEKQFEPAESARVFLSSRSAARAALSAHAVMSATL